LDIWIILGAVLVAGVVFFSVRKGMQKAKQLQKTSRPKAEFTQDETLALNAVLQQTQLPCIKLTPVRRSVGVYDSKLGGLPYLPPGFAYPHNTDPHSDKKPLKLLAQINFAQLPHLEGYPAEGILQFFMANEAKSDIYAIDFDNPTVQSGWRVVYHKQLIMDESQLQVPPALESGDEVLFPFDGEFALEAESACQPISCSDFRWQDFLDATIVSTEIYQSLKERMSDDDIDDHLSELSCGFGFRIGGYPAFTQEDPRGYGENTEHTMLLLQLDSWSTDGDSGIMFGDSGVANWFITPEALAQCDFSDVMYHWDCY